MAISQLYPNQRPTLNLNFARSKVLDPRITFTRNSTATYVGSDGLIKTAAAGEARFDHDANGDCRGLLIEQSSTNLNTQSETFSSSVYAFNNQVTFAKTQADPMGGTNATLVTLNAGTYDRRVGEKVTSGSNIGRSFFVKKVNLRYIYTGDRNGGGYGPNYRFDLDNGTGELIADPNNKNKGFSINKVGNGFYKISVFCNSSDIWGVIASNSLTNPLIWANAETMDGTGQFILFGWQVESGNFPSSYIPTNGAAVTRAADVCAITEYDWLNPTQCTWVTTAGTDVDPGYDWSRIINMTASGGGMLTDARGYWTYRAFGYRKSATSDYARPGTKGAFAYAENNIRAAQDGVFALLDTTRTGVDHGTITSLVLGSDQGINKFLNGYIERVSYYPYRLTDSQLQELTS